MKKNRLPDTDLANFAALEPRARRQQLEKFKLGWSPFSYDIFRRYLPDLLRLSSGAFLLDAVELDALVERIRRDCKVTANDIEAISNVAVARGARALAEQLGIAGRTEPNLAPRLIGGQYIGCWSRFVLNIDSSPVIPFFDPRRSSKKLTTRGKQVAFSIMHQSIRALDDDYANSRLAIVQFDDAKTGARTAGITYDDEFELFSYNDLDEMISATYRVWNDICEGRDEDSRIYDGEHDDGADAPPLARIWRTKP